MKAIPDNPLLKIPADAIENIRKIYNLDTPERLEETIKILEEWIQKQDHIIKKDFGKAYLEKTVISCKGSVEKAKKQIDRLCTMKTLVPKLFSKTNAKMDLQHILDMAYLVPLPLLTEDYHRVIVVKFSNKNITPQTFIQYYQYTFILAEYLKAHDYVNGFIIIDDYTKLNLFDVVSKMNTMELQQYMSTLIEGYGARMKSFHVLTDSKAIELLIRTIKHFVSEKIGNRMYVQSTLEDLHKVVPKEILPVEYGGNERSIEKLHAEWVEELSSEKNMEYTKMMFKACTDETKRAVGKFNDDYMGTPGSFRNMTVD